MSIFALAIVSDTGYTSPDMKHTVKNTSDTSRLVTITLDAEDLVAIKKNTLARLAKQVKAAGFRPGKVPVHIAEKQLDANTVNGELLDDAINSAAVKVLELEKIMPLDRPKVEVKKFVPDAELEFTAELQVVPNVKLGDYKKLKAVKPKVALADKDIMDVIDRLRRGEAVKQTVNRAAKNGDEVLIDFVGTDKDGQQVTGASGNDYALVLGSNSFIPGFEEGLVGKKAGDKATLALAFPKDYHNTPLAGTKINFAVTVKEVKEVQLPELNDELAAKIGPFKTVADLKADIKRELTQQKERDAIDALKDSLVEQLVKGSHVPVPDVLIEDQLVSLERDFVQNLMYRGQTLEQYLAAKGLTKEQWQAKDLREAATRRVQVGLALAELSKTEAIEVSKEELESRLEELLKNYSNNPEAKKQLDTPEARRDIANRLLTEKTVDRLIELNRK